MAKIAPKLGEAGERSPSVHYANWKEDILLKKQLHVLNRSEKSIVHRIRIDQKVLFKRFQDKLFRTKLGQARMFGEKEKERELRGRNLHGLNTDLGNEEKDYEFLKKLSYNPCKNNGSPAPIQTIRQKHTLRKKPKKARVAKNQIDVIIDDVFNEQVPRRRERSNSVTEGMVQDKNKPRSGNKEIDCKFLGIPPVVLMVRPATTDGQPMRHDISTQQTRAATGHAKHKISRLQEKKVDSKAALKPENDKTTKCPIITGRKDRKSASFFEEEEKVNLVDIRLKEIKAISYDDRIRSFYDTIEELACDEQAHTDYYTIRLKAAAKEPSHVIMPVPGTPDDEYQRHFGNLEVKSLTFKSLNLDFSKKEHISQDAFRPDLPTTTIIDSDVDLSDSDNDSD